VTGEILMDVEAEVSKIERGELRDLNIVKFVAQEAINISLEVPRSLIQLKEGGRARLIISTDPSIEHDVDGLFLCTIYNVERAKSGKEGRALVYGSIGGLQVRIEGKGLHKKFKAGDRIYLGIKSL
jgi:hypothetical protein